jgi:chorismate dehydratase
MTTLGVVPYLNAAPLVAALPKDAAVKAAVPSTLSAWLEEGSVDAALLPVAEALRGVGSGFLGTHGIASDGPVESVLAFSPRPGPPSTWPKEVVLDPASRTSAALLRVLLERRHGLAPAYVLAPEAGPDPAARPGAVTLVIGDRALALRRGWRGGLLDLGEAWRDWTGLPFVYARWTARRGLSAAAREALAKQLDAAAREGLARVEGLAKARGPAHGLSPDEARRYLGTSVRFVLGPREEAGLARFRDEIARLEEAAA